MKKEYSEYHKEYYGKSKSKKRGIIVMFFLLVMGIIFFIVFSDNFGITGNVVNSLNTDNSVNIKTSLSVSEIVLDGEYEEVFVSMGTGSFVYLDNKKIILNNVENKVILKNFNGKIEINEDSINKLEGKISEIEINNIPINLQSGGKLNIHLSPDVKYNLFEIKNGVYLKDSSFVASGNINFEGDLLNVNSERVVLKNYLGSLKIEGGKLILDGIIQNLKIEGDSRKISLSKN